MKTAVPMWKNPPSDLSLGGNEIHIWRAGVEGAGLETLAACRQLLSSDECQRADRFRFERHRRRFTLCRGLLRLLLGRYLATVPERIEFTYGEHGKPGIGTPASGRSLCLSLAHSRELALLAFSWHRALGIDVEYCRDMPRAQDLARRFFSPDEVDGIMRLPPERRKEGFFRCWTGKEAYVKATGEGFSFPMDRFSVATDPDAPGRLIRVAGAPDAPRIWSMTAFIPAAGYQAALAATGGNAKLRWWDAGPVWKLL
jgi:4'-phosphopantetheinyl transferase